MQWTICRTKELHTFLHKGQSCERYATLCNQGNDIYVPSYLLVFIAALVSLFALLTYFFFNHIQSLLFICSSFLSVIFFDIWSFLVFFNFLCDHLVLLVSSDLLVSFYSLDFSGLIRTYQDLSGLIWPYQASSGLIWPLLVSLLLFWSIVLWSLLLVPSLLNFFYVF